MESGKARIGIVGLGYVGGAVRHWFEAQKGRPAKGEARSAARPSLFFYDKYKNVGSIEEVNNADVIFVAVPTPFGSGGYDGSAVEESVAGVKDGKIIVIKSTVLPGTAEALQKKYPGKKILFNPEFLRAKTAVEDFLHPDRQVIGFTAESRAEAEYVLDLLPKAPHSRIMPATEAEMVKYFGNVFLGTKVIFANQMYDLCAKLGLDYDAIKECAALDPRIGQSHLEVHSDGYRGYGGGCFPKDTKALIQLARTQGLSPKLLEVVEEINRDLNGDTWCG